MQMTRPRRNVELWMALIAVLAISFIYVSIVIWFDEIPRSSAVFGHGIGVIGFVLMLMTETLYSIRKHSRNARWGRMSGWLNFHIFTGLVGPFMVLLHSAWKFQGLAGLVMLLTAVVVISGFIGRYIYTAVPRSADGSVISSEELEAEIANMDFKIQQILAKQGDDTIIQVVEKFDNATLQNENQLSLIFGRIFQDWSFKRRWRRIKGNLSPEDRASLDNLENLLKRRRRMDNQIRSLMMARRLLALWHSVHLPIGIVLFIAAFIHIFAAIYYATLLR